MSLDTSGSQRSMALWVNVRPAHGRRLDAVDCRIEPCVVAGFSVDGEPVASAALRFRAPLGISLAPADRAHRRRPRGRDGQRAAARPARSRFVHCMAGSSSVAVRCERPLPALRSADSSGLVTATLPARQRLTTAGGYGVCRATCTIAAVAPDGSLIAEAPYEMASPSVSVTPASDLTDGQIRHRRRQRPAADLRRRRSIFLPTGGWSLA